MNMKERAINTLSLNGGWLCLDFINTVHDYTEEDPYDYLAEYADFLDWSEKLNLLASSQRKELEAYAKDNQKQTDRVFDHLINLRITLYGLFRAMAQNKIPDDNTQAVFNSFLAEAMSHLQIRIVQPSKTQSHWEYQNTNLKYPLYPIIKSAYDLLTSDLLERIKECGECGWLFMDQSKNKSRKWCSMQTCGSNVKAKRYYYRNKE